ASISLQTPRLSLNQAQFRIGKELSSVNPLTLSWTLDADCLQALSSDANFVLDQPVPVLATIKRLTIPLDKQSAAQVQLESVIKQIHCSSLLPSGIFQLNDTVLKIEGNSLSE